ncbi:hypothetical protein [Ferrimonas balearica]|uniref:hypothetical protein n=1 Tax=Ferrimonas balearica TaxID=44012 RepID=UPI001F3063FA|nr:hypothetical protein [Ferrimonas balearica]MBY6093847.1 hypothetical protein [Ferrimonas balearica]
MKKLFQGNDHYLLYRVFDRDDCKIQYDVSSLSDVCFTLSSKDKQTRIATLHLGSRVSLQDGTHIAVKLDRALTADLVGEYYAQLDIYDANGDKATIYQGSLFFQPTIDCGV